MPKQKIIPLVCADCGDDCARGVSGVIKHKLYCIKHYRQRKEDANYDRTDEEALKREHEEYAKELDQQARQRTKRPVLDMQQETSAVLHGAPRRRRSK